MRIESFGKSDVGKCREKNEDSFLINQDFHLYIVADGMGGHLGGEYASRLAVNTIEEVVKSVENDPEATMPESDELRPDDYAGILRYAITVASRRIFEKAKNDPALHGMGTTSVVVLFRHNKAYIANVGDSRVYHIRKDKISQVTKDHSLVEEQVRAGILSAKDSRGHRFKNIITRSVGYQEGVESDVDIRVPHVGDRYLLCSDGLSNLIEDEDIRDIVINNGLKEAAERLIDVANERGGEDNITAVLIEVKELDEEDEIDTLSSESTIEA